MSDEFNQENGAPAADVQATEHNETGATREAEVAADQLEQDEQAKTHDVLGAATEVETAKYRILVPNVDVYDEQGNITGTLAVDSIQELPVEVGTKLVAEEKAEAVGTNEDAAPAVE